MEGQSVVDTVISAASHERHALAFNYASQALNNSFFLECLVCYVSTLFPGILLFTLKKKETATTAACHE